MNDIEKATLDVIEGEFSVLSGYSCRMCLEDLPVGSTSCPKCKAMFSIPTPSRARVPREYSVAKNIVMAEVFRDRIIDEEARKRRAVRKGLAPPRP